MKRIFKKICSLLFVFSFVLNFSFSQAEDYKSEAQESESSENLVTSDNKKGSFAQNLSSLEGHRFIELRGAIPAFPMLTSHGVAQSFVAAFSDVFGEIFAGGDSYSSTTPRFATDMNITVFPPIANYRLGFMGGLAIDIWDTHYDKSGESESETLSMNFAYIGFHGDYGHWVFNEIGMRLSLYGEVSIGWLMSDDGQDTNNSFSFDFCPLGIQFCPEKHVGIYFEFPHFGARPFFQTGLSIGF